MSIAPPAYTTLVDWLTNRVAAYLNTEPAAIATTAWTRYSRSPSAPTWNANWESSSNPPSSGTTRPSTPSPGTSPRS